MSSVTSKFHRASGISYNNVGPSAHLDVIRTLDAVSVTIHVGDGLIVAEASSDETRRSIQVNEGYFNSNNLSKLGKAVDLTEDLLEGFSNQLSHFADDEMSFIRTMEAEFHNEKSSFTLFLLLAMRPINMSRTMLAHAIGLVSASYDHKPDGPRTLKEKMTSAWDIWQYGVLVNALSEIDAAGSEEEIEETFLGLATEPEYVEPDDYEFIKGIPQIA